MADIMDKNANILIKTFAITRVHLFMAGIIERNLQISLLKILR